MGSNWAHPRPGAGPAQALKVAQMANLSDAYAEGLLPGIQEIRATHVTTLRKIAQCQCPRIQNP
jgi:hypothetical protein